MQRQIVPAIAILLILLKSVATCLVAAWVGEGLFLAIPALVFDLCLSLLLWKRVSWAPGLFALRLFGGLILVAYVAFQHGEFLIAAADAVITFAVLALLLGKPSTKRAFASLGVSVLVLVAIGGLMSLSLYQRYLVDRVVSSAEKVNTYRSSHHYRLELSKLPWKVVSSGMAEDLLGKEVASSDLVLVKQDGTSFGLFFPLQLPNVPFNTAFADRLGGELQQTLLSNLRNWKQYVSEDGFFLTADGPDEEVPISYVVLYKHFEGMGVYAVLWGARDHRVELLRDANALYDQLSAPTLKERLPRFNPSQIYQTNNAAVVQILVKEEKKPIARGTGFNIAPNGLIVTSRHLLTQGDDLEVIFPGKDPIEDVKVVGVGAKDLDLALLMVEGEKLPTVYRLRSVEVTPGDAVIVIGNPKGLSNSVSEGIVSAVRSGEEVLYYQVSAPMSSGSSGGPVFNEFGEVIGVSTSVVKDAQNLNFSIAVDELGRVRLLATPMRLKELLEKADGDK
jgi:Trypsin-like peptidase domain